MRIEYLCQIYFQVTVYIFLLDSIWELKRISKLDIMLYKSLECTSHWFELLLFFNSFPNTFNFKSNVRGPDDEWFIKCWVTSSSE